MNSTDLFVTGTCNRELSPVRWCDREVDGVYLGRSGWVQVQQRSLDENRRANYVSNNTTSVSSLQSSRRTGIKLAQYHCNSEPGKFPESTRLSEPQRPLYLSLQTRDFEQKSKTPSPRVIPESFSPPSVTPIISPPPAFQDKSDRSPIRTRTFFGKAPFLPRSNAIEDSDASPPTSPIQTRKPIQPSTSPSTANRKPKTLSSPIIEQPPRFSQSRLPQAKSLENTSSTRRSQFTQRYGDSSSSSSSSMGFRSLDSCVTRTHMPRLSENTDSSVDVYEDADDEDNNSSSLNLSIVSSIAVTAPVIPESTVARQKEKLSPSGRAANRTIHHRTQTRRSPAGSDTNRPGKSNSPSSSSTSSCELPPSRSPSGTLQQLRRPTPIRPSTVKAPQEDTNSQRVRRSRSLQLPEKKPNVPQLRVSPQHPEAQHKVIVKVDNTVERKKRAQVLKPQSLEDPLLDASLHREAEIVTEYLYGSRSRAAAQAQIIHNRYNNSMRDEKSAEVKTSTSNNYNTVFNKNRERQKFLQRGSTTPNLASTRNTFAPAQDVKVACTSETCDFWPHCAHRTTITGQTQPMMRLSQSYPSHQRSLDSETMRPSTVLERQAHDTSYKTFGGNKISPSSAQASRKTSPSGNSMYSNESERKRLSPNRSHKLEGSTDSGYDMKGSSPIHLRRPISTFGTSSNSSSSSDVWLTTSDRTVTKSPRAGRGSGTSTPLDEIPVTIPREIILTRPGSAPNQESNVNVVEAQQRSLSLPKSFLSPGNYPHG